MTAEAPESSSRQEDPDITPESERPRRGVQRVTGHRPRMSKFLRALVGLTLVLHVPFGVTAFWVARRFAWPMPVAFAGFAVALGTYLFLGRAAAIMPDKKGRSELLRTLDIAYFVHWCANIFASITSLAFVILAPLALLLAGRSQTIGAALDGTFCVVTYGAGLLVGAYGVLVRRRQFDVRQIDVRVRDLPKEFEGFTIAHLSDLHIGTLTPKSWGERWAHAATLQNPDIAVVTGDMVTSGVDFHQDIASVVGSLGSKLGVFVSMGNHDYFGDGEPLISLLREAGASVLRNEGVVLERGGARIFLAAIDDTWTRRDDMDKALRDRPEGIVTVLLAHDPDRWPDAVARNVALTLSGHTHGGQVAVPFLSERFSLSHLSHTHNLGIYEQGASKLYVHPGLGTTGPPIRLGVAPSVVILKLRAG